MKNLKYTALFYLLALYGFFPSISLAMSLKWAPTNKVNEIEVLDITAFENVKLAVIPFRDLRNNSSVIGEYDGKDEKVTTKDDVALWLTENVADVMKQFLQSYDKSIVKNSGTLNLEGDVIVCNVIINSGWLYGYTANVGLKFRLKSISGTVIWEGLASGKIHRMGGDFNAGDFRKALSDATLEMVHNFLKNESFLQAIKKGR